MAENNKIMIFAGETSGDFQGARLVRELKELLPHLEFSGVGGKYMKEAGVDIIFDSTSFGVIGAWEGIKKLPLFLNFYRLCREAIVKTMPRLVILIDTPSFNMRLAKVCRQKGIKTVYFFPPSAWSGSVRRAREIKERVDMMIPAFQFPAQTYQEAGIDYVYYGHPLIDIMNGMREKRTEIAKELGLPADGKYVALLPGSRRQEIKSLMNLLIETAERLVQEFPRLNFLIPMATADMEKMILPHLVNAKFPLWKFSGKSHEVMAMSELAIVASGTASLESAILGIPTIITYKINPLDYFLIRTIAKPKWCGLPNLILQRRAVPELIQDDATPETLFQAGKELLENEEKRTRMIKDLDEVRKSLGEPGVMKKIARSIRERML